RGVVYLVIALLAVNLARGGNSQVDQRGALEDIAHHPFGHVLVLVIAVGFACLAVWQAVLAARGRGFRSTPGRRVVAAGKAIVYLALSFGALAVFRNRSAGGGSDKQAVDVTARVMRHTLGRTTVGAVGITMCVVGVAMIVKALRRGFDTEVKVHQVPPRIRRAFEAIGMAGMTARGVVVGLIGYFVLQSAVTFNPTHAKGLDGALRSLVHDPFGPWLLGLLAVGLACFGLFSLLEVRYARA
ncbi:MAG TPA: DUF1206 domain-containing protein, partial [Acidimicrobiales bacterium]|nr:DUF1206 domain-containing protein [Acidimicrobiales bacterium]